MIYKVHVCGVPKDTDVAVKVFYQIDSDSKQTVREQMQLRYDSIWSTQLYTLMYQSKNKLILYYQLQGNNKTDLSAK